MRLKLNLAVILTALIVGVGAAFGGVIKTWSAGQILTPTDLNANFAHIHNNMVGGHGARLVDADVSATAAIATTKLAGGALIPKAWAQLTTACTTGTCALADSSGITSVVWTGTGAYTVTLSSARTGGYMILLTAFNSTTELCTPMTQSSGSFTMQCHLTATGAAENSAFALLVMDN